MLAGARDFLSKPPQIDDLLQSIQRAGEHAQRERAKAPPPLVARPAPVERRGKIIAVYSPRGGAGCTMLTCNLAIALRKGDASVVVVDGDLLYGDIPVLFDAQSKFSILDLAPRVAELDEDIVEEVLTTHASGVKLLFPPRPERAELVAGPHFSQLLTFLNKQYAYVLVDTAHRLSEVTMAALDICDLAVLVSTLDIPSIARVRSFLELLGRLNLDPQRFLLAVNQFDPRVGITPEKLTQAFGKEPAAVLPLAYNLVIESVNRGAPFMLRRDAGSQPISQGVQKLAEAVRAQLKELEKLPTREVEGAEEL
jgi:pilus assembly protein CpaE